MRILVAILTLGLVPPALAAGPVPLTERQLDGVVAGAVQDGLVNVAVEDTNVIAAVPVNAGVAANALCSTCTSQANAQQRPGRIRAE